MRKQTSVSMCCLSRVLPSELQPLAQLQWLNASRGSSTNNHHSSKDKPTNDSTATPLFQQLLQLLWALQLKAVSVLLHQLPHHQHGLLVGPHFFTSAYWKWVPCAVNDVRVSGTTGKQRLCYSVTRHHSGDPLIGCSWWCPDVLRPQTETDSLVNASVQPQRFTLAEICRSGRGLHVLQIHIKLKGNETSVHSLGSSLMDESKVSFFKKKKKKGGEREKGDYCSFVGVSSDRTLVYCYSKPTTVTATATLDPRWQSLLLQLSLIPPQESAT